MAHEEAAHPHRRTEADARDSAPEASQDDRTLAMVCHLLPLLGTSFVGPLVIWFVKKDESAFVADQALESLNFQITLLLAGIVSFLLVFVLIGFVLIPLLVIAQLLFGIIACIRSYEGQVYRYPCTLRLL